MEIKILVAIDGSVFSSNSLDYLINLFNENKNLLINLLSITSSSDSDQNWMFDVDPLREHSPAVERRIITAKRYLNNAKARLLRNGFKDEQIILTVDTSTSGIAQAIHYEATKGNYDSLLIGRRGMGMVGEMFFGSVSLYLLDKCHDVPLWILDGEVKSSHFLLAVHSTPQSLMAADHLGFIIQKNPNSKIYLYHSDALLGKTKVDIELNEYYKIWGRDWCDAHLDRDNYFLNAHRKMLEDNGVNQERVTILPAQIDLDPSHDLIRQAKKHDCGTVVIGRRGKGVVRGLIGGVSDRTMKQAQDIAVWVVN